MRTKSVWADALAMLLFLLDISDQSYILDTLDALRLLVASHLSLSSATLRLPALPPSSLGFAPFI